MLIHILDSQAFNLLSSLVTAGGTRLQPGPAFVPPPQHLALAATLIIHPSLTTRSNSPEKLQAADLSLQFLRVLLKLVGPLNAHFNIAFTFTETATTSRRGGTLRKRVGNDDSPTNVDSGSIDCKLATNDGLWAKAEDFWQVVGWAFNCSIAYKKRWERWRVWLDFMITVLEEDWVLWDDDKREESMIIKYLTPGNTMVTNEKRVVRAIFADGSARSLAEFKEVWKNETKERKPRDGRSTTRKAPTKINIDEGEFGDYLLDSSSSDVDDFPLTQLASSPPISPPQTAPTTYLLNGSDPLGGSTSISLRLRLLSLLSTISHTLPSSFTSSHILHDIYLTHIRPLHLSTFSLIVSPLPLLAFSVATASPLVQYILRSLISSSAPLKRGDNLTQKDMEKYYLPWPANTMSVEDNVKVSLCVETLFRLVDQEIGVVWSKGLVEAVEKGIEARDGKAKKEGKKKGEVGQALGLDEGKARLKASAARIRGIVEMAKR